MAFVALGAWNLWTALRFGYVSSAGRGNARRYSRDDNPVAFWLGVAICLTFTVLGALTLMGYSVGL
jgi:hypothetical protein